VARPLNVQDWGVEEVQGVAQAPQSIVVHEPQLKKKWKRGKEVAKRAKSKKRLLAGSM
jgi:hypothetical protein